MKKIIASWFASIPPEYFPNKTTINRVFVERVNAALNERDWEGPFGTELKYITAEQALYLFCGSRLLSRFNDARAFFRANQGPFDFIKFINFLKDNRMGEEAICCVKTAFVKLCIERMQREVVEVMKGDKGLRGGLSWLAVSPRSIIEAKNAVLTSFGLSERSEKNDKATLKGMLNARKSVDKLTIADVANTMRYMRIKDSALMDPLSMCPKSISIKKDPRDKYEYWTQPLKSFSVVTNNENIELAMGVGGLFLKAREMLESLFYRSEKQVGEFYGVPVDSKLEKKSEQKEQKTKDFQLSSNQDAGKHLHNQFSETVL